MTSANRQEVDQFCAAVVAGLGFHVDDHNIEQVEEVLRHRLRRTHCETAACYLRRLGNSSFRQAEAREVAAELSVGETYFFRHPEHFRVLAEVALPARMHARGAMHQLQLLSAGCASGEEPYSVAATVYRAAPSCRGWDIRIWGIDINHHLLTIASQAHYSGWSLRGMTEQEQGLYFRRQEQRYVLNGDIRSMVTFEERNLLDDDKTFWQPDFFDVIFCRNVMIYFAPPAVQELVERLTRSLSPGGFLFLGPSETLRGLTSEFHLRHTHGVFYYQRRSAGDPPSRAVGLVHSDKRPQAAAIPAGRDEESWVTAISQASTRIATLASLSKGPSHKGGSTAGEEALRPAPAGAMGTSPLEAIRELLRQERFDEGLRHVHALPAGSEADSDALLLQAVLLVNKAEVTKAQGICQQPLVLDETNAGAHYLMAVCQEHTGNTLAAAEHDQTAIYLDPGFAMPHLHLGLLARRLGDPATARRELTEALALLPREDGSRILLFGGGFHREALVQYCQSQLHSCGGSP